MTSRSTLPKLPVKQRADVACIDIALSKLRRRPAQPSRSAAASCRTGHGTAPLVPPGTSSAQRPVRPTDPETTEAPDRSISLGAASQSEAQWNESPQAQEPVGVRVVDREALLLDGVDEVDDGAVEVGHAHPVDDDGRRRRSR